MAKASASEAKERKSGPAALAEQSAHGSTNRPQLPAEEPSAGGSEQRGLRLASLLEAYGLVALTAGIFAFFTFLPATADIFPTVANIRVTVSNQSVLAIVAMAALIPLVAEEYDLSVGATTGLASILAASAFEAGWSMPLAFLVALGCGIVIGLVNGLLVTRARVNSLIATLGTTSIILGLISWKSNGQTITEGIPIRLTDIGTGNLLGIPQSVWIAFAVAVGTYYLLDHTPFGRYLYAVGSNRTAATLAGVGVTRVTLLAFVAAGMLAGAAGMLQLAVSGTGNPNVGNNFTLPALAAAFLSSAAIRPGKYNVWGTITAVLFLATLNSGLNLAGISGYINDIANGLALIVGVALASLGSRHRGLA